DASGTFREANRPGTIRFDSKLDLGELGRLLRITERPEGTVRLAGNAVLPSNNEYQVTGKVDARNVAIRGGSMPIAGVSLDSGVTADPHRIQLNGLRLAALGGNFAGSAAIAEMSDFQLSGKLSHFEIE